MSSGDASRQGPGAPPPEPGWQALAVLAGLAAAGAAVLAAPENPVRTALAAALLLALDAGVRRGLPRLPSARAGALAWVLLVAAGLAAAPGLGLPTMWLAALPLVAAPPTASAANAAVAALVLASAAAGGLALAGDGEALVAAAALLAAGLLAALHRHQGEAAVDLLARRERELEGVRADLRSLRGELQRESEDRLISLTRANAALQLEIEQRKAAATQALEANRTKSSFLANISHELRTPLNAIVGYTDLLLEHAEERHDPQAREDLDKIRRATHDLLRLVENVLDLAKIEAGKLELRVEEVPLQDLLDALLQSAAPLAERAGNTLKLRVPRALGSLRTDRTRLRQVLWHLLSNACKFTAGGQIELRVEPIAEGLGGYEFTVRDTGCGIDPAYLPRLFSAFSQADESSTRRFGGAGLGLALCKHTCTLLGGEIAVESELGRGTTFRVRLPLDPREGAPVVISVF